MRVQNKKKNTHTHSSTHFFLASYFSAALVYYSLAAQISFTTHLTCDGLVKNEAKKMKTNEMPQFFCAVVIQAFLCQDLHVPNIICIPVGMRLWFHFSWLRSRGMRINFRFEFFFVTAFDQKNERENEQRAKERKRRREEKKIGEKSLKKYRFKHLINIFLGDSTMEQAQNTHTRHMIRNDNSGASIHGKKVLRSRKIK